jgi:hypothetical protein
MRLGNSIRLIVAVVALAATSVLSAPARGQVSIGITVGFPPPELPVYEQPICPGEGYIWTPGYWAWDPDDEDYYWVPGTWVLAPEVGYLWTPGYWAWGGSGYAFYPGYWGPVVGFYGGINYGYGYFGHGYEGGRWDRGHFYYNREVNHINVTEIHNVYNTKVVYNNVNVTRVSYNGGRGGVNAQETAQERAVASERHIGPVAAQTQHVQEARSNRQLRASENHGKPPIAATQRPAAFTGGSVVPAKKGAKYNPPPNRGVNNRVTNNPNQPTNARPENNANRPAYVHPNDLPKANRPDRPPNTGNPKTDQKYQKEQERMYQKQEQDRQKLQQRQDQEHQRMQQQQADEVRRQQTEQRHQQQTQQMQQRHEQQQHQMEQRQQPRQQEQRQQPPPHGNETKPPKPQGGG